jgi:hypothetical protein
MAMTPLHPEARVEIRTSDEFPDTQVAVLVNPHPHTHTKAGDHPEEIVVASTCQVPNPEHFRWVLSAACAFHDLPLEVKP